MSHPEIVQSDLADEDVVARVDLGGEDELYVTPTRTLLYRAEGLLSDESVEEYPHEAERITVSEGRRKAKVTLDYGLDGEKTISLPAKRLERALHPIVEGVLKANGVLAAEEPMERLFRFSELTIAIAGERVVRHIGASLWDEDCEVYDYDDVTDLDFEDGSVATSVVLTVDGRQERFKAPNDEARAVRAALETTLLSYWDVDSVAELRAAAEPDEDEAGEETEVAEGREVSFGDGPDPLIADPAEPDELPENATRADEADDEPRPTAGAQDASDTVAQQVERPSGTGADPLSEPERENEPKRRSESDQGNEPKRRNEPDQVNESEPSSEPSTDPSADASGSTSDEVGTSRSDSAAEADPERATSDTGGVDSPAPGSARGSPDEASHDDLPRGETEATQPTSGGRTTETAANETQNPGDAGFEGSGFEAAAPPADERILEELADLRETVERQNEELQAQRELVEQLIEELRRGR